MVWGITLFCDWSVRTREPLGPMNFAPGKNFDTSASLGPCIVVDEADCTNIDIETFVNGQRRQAQGTKDNDRSSFRSSISNICRATATVGAGRSSPAAAPAKAPAADASPTNSDGPQPPDSFRKIGDQVEIKSPQLGSLKAKIVAKAK